MPRLPSASAFRSPRYAAGMSTPTHALRFARALALAGSAAPMYGCVALAHAQSLDLPANPPACPATMPQHRSRCATLQLSCSYQPPNHVEMSCTCSMSNESPRRPEWFCHHPIRNFVGPLPPPELRDALADALRA